MDTKVPLKDQIAELRREARYRRSAYPRFVQRETLTQEECNLREERLAAAIDTLEAVFMERHQLKLPL